MNPPDPQPAPQPADRPLTAPHTPIADGWTRLQSLGIHLQTDRQDAVQIFLGPRRNRSAMVMLLFITAIWTAALALISYNLFNGEGSALFVLLGFSLFELILVSMTLRHWFSTHVVAMTADRFRCICHFLGTTKEWQVPLNSIVSIESAQGESVGGKSFYDVRAIDSKGRWYRIPAHFRESALAAWLAAELLRRKNALEISPAAPGTPANDAVPDSAIL